MKNGDFWKKSPFSEEYINNEVQQP